MKLSFKAFVSTALVAGMMLAGCGDSAKDKEKKEQARQDSIAKVDSISKMEAEAVAVASDASTDDYDSFKATMQQRIDDNDKKIAELKEKMKKEKKKDREKYEKRINELEQKNKDMKMKIGDYKKDGNWDQFKREFNHDMDELGTALGDLFKNNTK